MQNHLHFFFILLALPTLVFGQVDEPLDNSFSNPTHLSDQQMDNANNFVHQGVKDRVIKEGCKDINNCQQESEGFPLEMLIGKAYALLGVVSGGGGLLPTLNKKPTAEAIKTAQQKTAETGKKVKPEKEKQNDYCMMAAMAYETVGGFLQQSLQQKANNQVSNDMQLQALISLEQTHKARAKTASFQRAIYGAVSLCYGAMLLTASVDPRDIGLIAKMGGAAALTTLYWRKVDKHKNAAKKVAKVIASLPSAGKGCDPWTKTPCFCKEETSKTLYPAEYQEVCVLNDGNFDTPKIAMGCAAVDGNKLQYDKECKCKQTNSCLKSTLKAYNPKFSIGNNLMNEANKTFDLLNSGEFDQGKLDQASLNARALASKMNIKSKPKLADPKLTPEQKKMADALKPYMNEDLAKMAAASKSGYTGGIKESNAGSAAVSKLPESIKQKLADAINVDYKKGSGNTMSSASDEPAFTMPLFPGQEVAAANNNTEIISFAEQAISKADVSNSPETPIFDIISNRYRRSGWQKLDRIEK